MSSEIRVTRDLYLWCMSVIYLFAFTSLFVQIPGLYGDNGILPAKLVLENEARNFHELVVRQPTLLRLLPSIGFDVQTGMDFICLGGAILAFVAVVSRDQRNCVVFAALWIFYLSLFQVGQTFLWFHWDVLLLEAGFLTIIVAPLNYFGLHDSVWYRCHDSITLFLVRWLLFRLTFASGLAKLTSCSESWWKLTALKHHYETQFLPTPFAWYFHQLPDWIQRLSAAGILTSQIAGSLFMLSPIRHQRLIAFYSQVLLMTLMTLTGNFGFYPLLSLTLCLSLMDDRWLNSWSTSLHVAYKSHAIPGTTEYWWRGVKLIFSIISSLAVVYVVIRYFALSISTQPFHIQSAIAFSKTDVNNFAYYGAAMTAVIAAGQLLYEIIITTTRSYNDKKFTPSRRLTEIFGCLVIGLFSIVLFAVSLVPHLSVESQLKSTVPQFIHDIQSWTATNYRLTSPYLFYRRSVDEEDGRAEVVMEASDFIQSEWKEYNFRFKPGNVSSQLPIASPHQPRLDCQMWFAARGPYQHNIWLLNLVYRLLTHQPEVLELMAENPFPTNPPKYIRASLYKYHFTSSTNTKHVDKEVTGWWTRERVGDYLPIVSLDEPSFMSYIQSTGLQTEDTETRPLMLLGQLVSWLRSLLGQGNGSSACLVLVVTGFLLTLFDPSIALFNADTHTLVDGDAVCSK